MDFLLLILLSTGQDNPLGLFGYIALLNIGVAAVVLRKRWDHLLLLAAVGTVFMELLWVDSFFHVPKAALAFTIFLGFELQFLLVYFLRRRNAAPAKWAAWAAAICGFASLGFAAYILRRLSRAFAKSGFTFRFHLCRGPRPCCSRDCFRSLAGRRNRRQWPSSGFLPDGRLVISMPHSCGTDLEVTFCSLCCMPVRSSGRNRCRTGKRRGDRKVSFRFFRSSSFGFVSGAIKTRPPSG